MNLRHCVLLAALLLLLPAGPAWSAPAASATPWVVYYGDRPTPAKLAPYRLAVLDPGSNPDLARIRALGTVVLGYLSLGEAESYRPYFADAKAAGVLAGENPNWKGSFFVDLRRPAWRSLVLDRLAPQILAQGFSGLFLDTLDDARALEDKDPVRYRGMTAAAAELVKALHQRFPTTPLMMNRAFELVPSVARDITMLLGEGVYADYDAAHKRYAPVAAADYRAQVAALRKARRLNPALTLFSLDYWNPSDRRGIARIYALERANGFNPYVATLALDRIVPQPGPGGD